MKIILASKSERRKELLKKICKNFDIVESNFDESKIDEKDPVMFAINCALGKAKEVGERFPDNTVIGADTIVYHNGEIIGKPQNYEEAKKILKKLSGSRHQVITGIAIYNKNENKILTDYDISFVKFKELSEEEIEEYLKTEDFRDKAGAYGIQNINDKFVDYIEGDFDNIVGLPVKKLEKLLFQFLYNEITVEIYDYAFPNNWGVGRYNNLVIFVPGTVIGDRVKIKISKELKNYSFGEIVEIEKPSDFRVQPLCEHFGICGGCSLQNLQYEKQIELKKEYLENTLKKIANLDLKITTKFLSPEIYFYRNKMEFAFGKENGNLIIGLRERVIPYNKNYKKKVVPIKRCLIFSEKVEKIFPLVLDFFQTLKIEPYDPFTKKGQLRHLVVKESKNKKEIMIIIVTKKEIKINFEKLVTILCDKIKEIKSIYWVGNDQIADVVAYEEKKLLFGSPFIEETMDKFSFRIYPETFFQPNTKCAEILYKKLVEEIEKNENILGLYCGTGPIEIFVSEKSKSVVGIDWEVSNINTAKENCEINKIENCKFYAERAEKFLNLINLKFDRIIVDPPRGGLSKKVIHKIVKTNCKNITYISCNPSTLARDLKEFIENGYEIEKIFLFDFFPHTSHLESLCFLRK